MTTLVPYIQAEPTDAGGVHVRRKYRVSEINRDPGKAYEDINDVYQELSEETVAFIANHLRIRSRRYHERAIPINLLGWLVAILRPLVFEQQSLALAMRWTGSEPTIVLRDGVEPRTLLDVTSQLFVLRDGGVVPTEHFQSLSRSGRLRIDRREESVEVEDYLGLLVNLIDSETDSEKLHRMLAGWALSADRKLGLGYVQGDLEAALRKLEDPLKRRLRDEVDERPPVDLGAVDAQVGYGLMKLTLLSGGWDAEVRAHWDNPSRRQRLLLASLAAPREPATYEFVRALAELTLCARRLTATLDRADLALQAEGGAAAAQASADEALTGCADIQRALTWLDGETSAPAAPHDPREALTVAVDGLLGLLGLTRSFLAAVAGSYRGPRGARLVYPRPTQRTATLLYVDLSRSREHASKHGVLANHEWKNSGLNLIAQWAKAFGGREMKDREGDAIWLEFAESGDPAVLCAAAVQQHVLALRSTGVDSLWWGLHVAVDHGNLIDGDGGNVVGEPCDRIALIAKGSGEEDLYDDALVTDEAASGCSASLRDERLMRRLGYPIVLVDAEGDGRPGSTIHPLKLNTSATMELLCRRILTATAAIAPEMALDSSSTSSSTTLIDDAALGGSDWETEEPSVPGAQA
jgi:hypothetical protein